MALPGTARLMTGSPRSPSPSPAPGGMVRASLAYGIMTDRQWEAGRERAFGQAGPLCDLYEGLHPARPRSGIQLAGCAIRCRFGLYQEPGPCRLDPDPVPVGRWGY